MKQIQPIVVVSCILVLLFLFSGCTKKAQMMLFHEIEKQEYLDILKDTKNRVKYELISVNKNKYDDLRIMIRDKDLTFISYITKFQRYSGYDASTLLVKKTNKDQIDSFLTYGNGFEAAKPYIAITIMSHKENIDSLPRIAPILLIDRVGKVLEKIIIDSEEYRMKVVVTKCARMYFQTYGYTQDLNIDFMISPNDSDSSNIPGNLGFGVIYNKATKQSYLLLMAYDREKEFTWDVFYDFYNALNIERILEL